MITDRDKEVARIFEVLNYNPITGIFTWKVDKKNKIKPGSVAGYKSTRGYVDIQVDGKSYRAHRLAWLFQYGYLPPPPLDHIDGNKTNNAIANLRCTTIRGNGCNRKEHRNGHLPGAMFEKASGKWKSMIKVNGKNVWLGYFPTEQAAHNAYMSKRMEVENV